MSAAPCGSRWEGIAQPATLCDRQSRTLSSCRHLRPHAGGRAGRVRNIPIFRSRSRGLRRRLFAAGFCSSCTVRRDRMMVSWIPRRVRDRERLDASNLARRVARARSPARRKQDVLVCRSPAVRLQELRSKRRTLEILVAKTVPLRDAAPFSSGRRTRRISADPRRESTNSPRPVCRPVVQFGALRAPRSLLLTFAPPSAARRRGRPISRSSELRLPVSEQHG